MADYFDVLLAKNLAGSGGGGGGGGTAMYRHDLWLTDFYIARLNLSIVTDSAAPLTSLGELASALYANGFTGSNYLTCVGFFYYSATNFLVCAVNTDETGTKLNYNGPQTSSLGTSYSGGEISFTPTRFYDVVTAL